MANQPAKPACDCLNWCGDDPWLNDGRAEPCQDKKDHDRRVREKAIERQRIMALANQLADSALKHGTVSVDGAVMDDIRTVMAKYIKP